MGVITQTRGGDDCARRVDIEFLTDGVAVNRRRIVKEDASLRCDDCSGLGQIQSFDGVAHKTTFGLRILRGAYNTWHEQTTRGIMQNFTRVRVNRLQQPGGNTGLRIYTSADAQNKTFASRKVKVALEVDFILWNMDVYVA